MRPGETRVPIPNTRVKAGAADGTMLGTAWESRWVPDNGGIAQLGEHLPCKQGVRSSNLLISTGAGDCAFVVLSGRKGWQGKKEARGSVRRSSLLSEVMTKEKGGA